MRGLLLALFVLVGLSANDGIYNYDYNPNSKKIKQEKNSFLDGNFDKIYRFEPLYFTSSGELSSDSNETLEKIKERLKALDSEKLKRLDITVIGHTRSVENSNEEVDLKSAYTNLFQSMGEYNELDSNKSAEEITSYIKKINDFLVKNGVDKEQIYVENRLGKDPLFTEGLEDGRELNHRVDVSIYETKMTIKDSDGDGVFDNNDYCPDTPNGLHVDMNGCPTLKSLDLKFDFDKATLKDKDSINQVYGFAEFMKNYPMYHAKIIGHTDSMGSEAYNQKLSIKRAKTVYEMLIKYGIAKERLAYDGRGEIDPISENDTPEGRHSNRRTDIELTIPVQKDKEVEAPKERTKG